MDVLLFNILMVLGYGILFSYFLVALNKKEIRYLRESNQYVLERLEERFERQIERLKRENIALQREMKRKGT